MRTRAIHINARILRCLAVAVLAALVGASILSSACLALPPDRWEADMGVLGYSILGFAVGVFPWTYDGWEGGWPNVDPGWQGVLVLQHNEHGPDWSGRTGFYYSAFGSPITPGGSKTWSNIYMWAQNTTPPDQVMFGTVPGDEYHSPVGYTGHLVLDYVPASANWTGPTEFWLELDARNLFSMPMVTVTDPLDGIRMHLTVYAPVPEPAPLLALATGLVGLACWRKRR